MAISKGKQFESKFLEDWKLSFPNSFIFRLHDQVSGYKITSQNPCDFICFTNNKLFLIECKSHQGSSIPFTAMPQYERLLAYKDMKDIFAGFMIWFMDNDIVLWVDIQTAEKIYNDGNKSIRLKMFQDKMYNIKEVPSNKKRVFMDSDYTFLIKDEV